MIINKATAIKSLLPDSEFSIAEDVITWHSTDYTQPTDAEIDAEVVRLQAEYDNNEYQRDRAAAYPSIQDQLDMQYHDAVNGTTTWKDAIQAVKDANPKPSE